MSGNYTIRVRIVDPYDNRLQNTVYLCWVNEIPQGFTKSIFYRIIFGICNSGVLIARTNGPNYGNR